MSQKLRIIVSIAVAPILTLPALAQHTHSSKTDRSNYNLDKQPRMQWADQLNDASKVGEIIGTTVNNCEKEKLGKVEDISVDLASDRIVGIILSAGRSLTPNGNQANKPRVYTSDAQTYFTASITS